LPPAGKLLHRLLQDCLPALDAALQQVQPDAVQVQLLVLLLLCC
jgi:hypothetical protein